MRNLVPIAVLTTVFACSRYLGHSARDAAAFDQPPSGERLTPDGSASDGWPSEGVPADLPGMDLASPQEGSIPDPDGTADDGPSQDLPPPSCLSWNNDWTCDNNVSGYTCVASCGTKKILCDNNKTCTCNSTVSCGQHTGTACMVCSGAFQSGCCQ